jgi:phosphoribosylamine--glycine ligase
MKVLVIGSGAREHAILWKLAQSPHRPALFAAPGNAGTIAIATNLPVFADDLDGLLQAVRRNQIDLTIVGAEGPLAAGVVDRFRSEGQAIFGPTRAAARIETSKVFAKTLMAEQGVPTAPFRVFDHFAEAAEYVRFHGAPIVVKADGLTAGKGVVVAETLDEAYNALDTMLNRRLFGDAGARVLVEDCLYGQEVSVFCFTNGSLVTPLVAACDYKRVADGDRGPNTGGMGAYSPPHFWTPELERDVRERIVGDDHQTFLEGLCNEEPVERVTVMCG